MFWNKESKRLNEIEKSIDNIRDLISIHNKTINSINEMILSLHNRLILQQKIVDSVSKQLDIIAEATLFKEAKKAQELVDAKPTLVKEPEH